MKYILTILLGCLIYSAQGQSKRFPDPPSGSHIEIGDWLGFLWERSEALEKWNDTLSNRLESLLHAFQTMHDSLVELQKRPFFYFATDSTHPIKQWNVLDSLPYLIELASDTTVSAPKKKRRKG